MKQVFYLLKQRVSVFLALFMCSAATLMAQVSVKGTVVDTNGDPIIGANVLEVGTTNGVVTDVDGNFTLQVNKLGVALQISYIGYTSKTINAAQTMKIELNEDSEILDDVVVVGYGTTKRKNFTGSVSTMNITDSPVANTAPTSPTDMLRGLVPGLSMGQSSVAGSTASIQIRGQKSINGGSEPLIVLNGVIFKGTLNDIDPNIVESMSVLKDATSLAAYGSQAANGVIMITTKKGALGKPMVNFRSSVAINQAAYKPELRDGKGYIELINARQGLPEGSTNWMTYLEKENYDKGEETDWIDFYSQTGVRQNYSLNISGATENLDYSLGGAFTDNKNFIKGNTFTRYTINGRFNTKITKYIKAGLNFNYANMAMDGVRPYTTRYFSPWGEPYLEDGKSLRKYITEHTTDDVNPLWQVEDGNVDMEVRMQNISLGGEIEIQIPGIKGLSYKITGTYNTRNNQSRRFNHEKYYIQIGETYTTDVFDSHLTEATGYINNTKYVSYVLDNIVTYTKEFGKNWMSFTGVYTRDSDEVDGSQESGTDFKGLGNTTLGFHGLNNAKTQKVDQINYTLHTNVGYLLRGNYSYNDTYHFNASVRWDGSSVFGRDKKWGTFPAVGVAWTIANESFWKKALPWATNTKIKVSWGKNGNQSLQPYQTLSQMSVGMSGGYAAYFGDGVVFGQALSTLGNPMLGWETTTSWNYGLETDFLNGRIHWEIDAYNANTTDQIFNRTIPVMGSGLSTQQSTMGKILNWGIESTLRTMNIKKKDFSWSTNLQFTLSRSILKELYGDGNDDITNELFLNKSLGAIYGYKFDRVAQVDDTKYLEANNAKPGDPMYVDQDGDGVITPKDRMILGYMKPSFMLNMGNTLTWKDLSLYFLFTGTFSGGEYGYDRNNNAFVCYESMAWLNAEDHPFWTEANRDTKHLGPTADTSKFTGIQKYGFVRLQDVNLSYNIRGKWMKKAGINSLQVYASGSNLFFIAPGWEFSDPEIRSSRATQLARTFTFGLNVRF